MNSFLLTIATFLVLALSAVFAVPYFVDWNAYRGVFEAQASRLIGRSVEVGGNVQLTLLPSPVLRFEDVTVADRQGGTDRPFGEARSFTIWLAVPPLLRGTVQARQIDLERPTVNLKIDAAGAGNWSDIGGADVTLPFLPKEIALDAVRITDGTVTFAGATRGQPLKFEGLDGEFSARSLQGPFKFAGSLALGGRKRDISFSTGRREHDGSTRLKVVVRDVDGRRSYALDGDIRDLAGAPRFDGRVSAWIAGRPDEASDADRDAAAPIEVKSEVKAGLNRAIFQNLEITVRRGGRPQTIAGRLEADWQNGLVADGQIRARWFDLGSLSAGGGEGRTLSEALPALAGWALEQAGHVHAGRLRIGIEQAVFGGDLIHDLDVDVSATKEGLRLNRIAGQLPGENTLDLTGTVRRLQDGPAFVGHAKLEGRRLSRFVRWAGLKLESFGRADETGAFSIEADLLADAQKVAIEKASGDLLGTAFTGAFRYRTGARRELVLELDSDRIDMTKVLGPTASLGSVLTVVAGSRDDEAEATTEQTDGAWLADAEARLDLRAGTVVLPGFGEGSMTAKLRLIDGELDIRKFDLKAENGVSLRAEGRLAGIPDRPDGKLTLLLNAPTPEGVQAAAALFALPSETSRSGHMEALAPLNVVATIESGDRKARELKFNLGGTAGGGDMGLSGSFKGDLTAFAEGQIALRGAVGNADGKVLIRQIFPDLREAAIDRFAKGRGVLRVAAKGSMASALETKLALDAAGIGMLFDGEAAGSEQGFALSGSATLKAQDIAGALALAGIELSPGQAAVPLDLRGRLVKSAERYQLKDLTGQIGDQRVDGTLAMTRRQPRPMIEATLKLNEAVLSRLLQPTLAWDRAGGDPSTIRGVSATPSYWPDKRFNQDLLGAFDGRLAVTARRLRLAEGIVIQDATLDARLDDGNLAVPAVKGKLYGGQFRASARLAQRGSGMAFLADAEATGLKLGQVTRAKGRKALATGSLDMEMSVSGEALTPRGLAASLAGEGELSFGPGRISSLSPAVLKSFAQAESGKEKAEARSVTALRKTVATRLKTSAFAHEPLSAVFTVRNGTARFKRVSLETESGEAMVSTYVDLANMRFDSEWVLRLPSGAVGGRTPEITVAFAGSLLEFGRIAPDVDTQVLERYITMRRMEQDVERLENLDVQGPGQLSDTVSSIPKPPKKAVRGNRRTVDEPPAKQTTPDAGRAAALREPPPAPPPPVRAARPEAVQPPAPQAEPKPRKPRPSIGAVTVPTAPPAPVARPEAVRPPAVQPRPAPQPRQPRPNVGVVAVPPASQPPTAPARNPAIVQPPAPAQGRRQAPGGRAPVVSRPAPPAAPGVLPWLTPDGARQPDSLERAPLPPVPQAGTLPVSPTVPQQPSAAIGEPLQVEEPTVPEPSTVPRRRTRRPSADVFDQFAN